MTQTEALKLALEALESTGENNGYHGVTQYFDETMVEQAITAIKAALANEALERKAENARELGLDYEPQRTWAGLTDEEITKIFSTTKGLDFYLNFARAIEAAHDIKGEA